MDEAIDALPAPRLRLIRVKLDRLKASDRRFRIQGAGGEEGHRCREDRPLDDAGLAHLEHGYGVALPGELRAFLRHVHGGGPGPGFGLRLSHPAVPWARAARPFPYDSRDAEALLARRQGERYARLPLLDGEEGDDEGWPPGPGFIPLAHHGCGMFSVLVVTGEQRGLVWFCDMGRIPDHSEAGQRRGFLDWYEAWLDRHLPREA